MTRTRLLLASWIAAGACRAPSPPTAAPSQAAVTTAPAAGHATELPAADLPVMGLVGMLVPDVDAARKVLVEGFLGTQVEVEGATTAMIRFLDVVVVLRQGEPEGGSKGSVVDHIGFRVPNLEAALPRIEGSGATVVTADELDPVSEGKSWFNPDQATNQAFIMVPGGIKVEVSEVAGMTLPVLFHHVHFVVPDNHGLRRWYATVFEAALGQRGGYATADLPGVNLTFSASDGERAPTRNRALEHIGLDVVDLPLFCKKLEAAQVQLHGGCGVPSTGGFPSVTLADPAGALVVVTQSLYEGATRPHWGAR